MAEALVEERPTMPSRYYCHMCNVEINIPNENFTCPLCAGGFVEELPALPQTAVNAAGAGTSRTANGTNSTNSDPFNRLATLMALRGEFARMSENESGANSPTAGANRGSARVRQNLGPNFLIDFLNSLDGHIGNTSMVYLGNIGDYAWGREGIDTIVTQLLNQMETAGPPPLPKEKIQEIPKVQVTKDEVDKKTQCSVCWEDFELNEIVRKLPCSHIYHENCIVPWLDLHGTCPICRKSLNNDEEGGGADESTTGHTQNSSNPRSGSNAGGSRSAGGTENAPPTMRNNALDDLD